ncbi:MAG: hypothetical protein ABIU09_02410 [Pyrinomonadaceae bacterium]
MENKGHMNSQELAMQALIGRYLKIRSTSDRNASAKGPHLDNDSLAAFTEGNLSALEARPLVRHMVDCSFCRHVTAELIRLDLAFADNPAMSPIAETTEPSRISEVMNGLLSKIFGTSDGAVFAHNEEKDEEVDKKKDSDADDSKDK